MNQDSTSDTVVNSLSSELDALKEIYLKELQLENEENRTIVSVNLSPSTADLKDKQYVCLTLQLTVTNDKYPQESPLFHIRNPRGLSEETVTRIIADLNKIAEDRKGTNMLYHLIDFVKESLTSNNFPSDKCMICLYEFTKEDVFVVTKCFHHFHCYCLAHYIQQQKEESSGPANGVKSSDSDSQPCPVCREDQDFTSLVKDVDYPPPSLSSKPIPGENVILEEARQKQESFAPIFEKQQQQGGIINEEEEKNKFLLRTSDSNAGNPSSSTSESTSKQNSPSKSSDSSKGNVTSADSNPAPQDKVKDDAKSGSVESTSNGHLTNENKVDDKEDDGDDKNEEWSDAKPEISPDTVEVKDESKDESKTSNESKSDDPSKSESGSNKGETEIANGKTESETEAKDSAAEKDASKEKAKRNKSSRRNSRRNRTRSSGRRASAGDGAKSNGDEVSQNNGRRNHSRRRNRTNSYDPNTYGGDYRSQNFRSNNRGNPRMRRPGRNNVGYSSNGGLPSPPYKRNFGTASYGEENGTYRSDGYPQETYRDRDRPGFYAARVIRPSAGNNANAKARNGTRGSEDSSKASISPQADSSEVTQSTSEQEQQTQTQTRSRSKNKRRNRRNRTASRSQNGRHSESDYQNSNQQGNDYSNSNSNKMNNRQGYNYNYNNNYRSQGSYGRSSYGGGYYNGNYPNFSYGYSANYNGYGNGYGNNYNNNYYGRYNGNYGNGNYYRQRPNYNRTVQQRNNNYRPNYKPRKRTDTGQSQSSVKSNSNNKTTETVPVQTEQNGTVVEIVA